MSVLEEQVSVERSPLASLGPGLVLASWSGKWYKSPTPIEGSFMSWVLNEALYDLIKSSSQLWMATVNSLLQMKSLRLKEVKYLLTSTPTVNGSGRMQTWVTPQCTTPVGTAHLQSEQNPRTWCQSCTFSQNTAPASQTSCTGIPLEGLMK